MNKELEDSSKISLQFEKRGGLVPVIVQNEQTLEVLMLGYTNQEAFDHTQNSGNATFWSTSRNELWEKGATSGDYLKMKGIKVDCDQDCLLYLVEPIGGGSCHTFNESGEHRKSCFYRELESESDLRFNEK